MSNRLSLVLLMLVGACASHAPQILIPQFSASDPRVQTAGFVGETLRLHRDVDGQRYTLMAFVVGDTLTLGAMVKGAFAGDLSWKLGARTLRMPFDTKGKLRAVVVRVEPGESQPVQAEGASFRGITWLNVEVPAAWLGAADTELRLVFSPAAGSPIALPEAGGSYRATLGQMSQ